MDQVITFFLERPLQCLILAIGSFSIAVFLHNQAKAMKFAQWVAADGQYQPLESSLLDEAIQEAKNDNVDDEFMSYLRIIRSAVGHTNLKIGHLYWIWHQMENRILAADLKTIPSFDKNNMTEIPVTGVFTKGVNIEK